MNSRPSWRLALAAGVASTCVTPAFADDPAVDLTIDPGVVELGESLRFLVDAPAGSFGYLVLAGQTGSFELPGLVDFGLYVDANSPFFMFTVPSSGTKKFGFPTSCDNNRFVGVPIYSQAAVLTPPFEFPFCMTPVRAVTFVNGELCALCLDDPETDPAVSDLPGGCAISLFGDDFEVQQAADYYELGDGTASVKVVLRSKNDADDGFVATFEWSGRVDVSDPSFPPAGAPNLKLFPSAYVENGGVIDTTSWAYFPELEGTLVGFGDYTGALVEISEGDEPAQIGFGANGRSTEYGLCSLLDADVVEQPSDGPHLDDEHDVELVLEDAECISGSPICVTSSRPGDHAFYLPDLIGDIEWMFEGGPGEFTELPDGTATLTGRIVNEDDPDLCFDVDGLFSGLVSPGDASYPPPDSPKLGQVDDDDLVENGGTVDPDTFHYYLETTIVLNGCKDLEGAIVLLTRKGPAFQVGTGANWHDTDEGASGWLYWHVIQQPDDGPHLPHSGHGDLNFDIVPCPTRSQLPVVHYDFSSQAGETVVDRSGSSVDLVFEREDGDLVWTVDDGRQGLRFEQGSSIDTCLRRPDGTDAQTLLDLLQGGQAFTVQAVFRASDEHTNDTRLVTFSSSTSVNDRNFSLMAYPESDGLELQQRVKAQDGTFDDDFDSEYDSGDLVVYTMSYDGLGDQQVHVYVNGEREGRFLHGGDLRDWTLHPFVLGNEHGGDRPFDGTLYDVKIWNRPITEAEAATEAAEQLAGS